MASPSLFTESEKELLNTTEPFHRLDEEHCDIDSEGDAKDATLRFSNSYDGATLIRYRHQHYT